MTVTIWNGRNLIYFPDETNSSSLSSFDSSPQRHCAIQK